MSKVPRRASSSLLDWKVRDKPEGWNDACSDDLEGETSV